MYNKEDVLIYRYGVENQPKPSETPLVFFACSEPIAGFDCDRDVFVGNYRSEENPRGVERETLENSLLYGGDPCFALQIPVDLEEGEEKTISVFLGTAMTEQEVVETVERCRRENFYEQSKKELEKQWNGFLSRFQCHLPDADEVYMRLRLPGME